MSASESAGMFDVTHCGRTREVKLIDDRKPCGGHTRAQLHRRAVKTNSVAFRHTLVVFIDLCENYFVLLPMK